MLLEVLVVTDGVVVAEVRAAALSAGEGETRMAPATLLSDCASARRRLRLPCWRWRGATPRMPRGVQCRGAGFVRREQPGVGPHTGLETGNDVFDVGFLAGRQGAGEACGAPERQERQVAGEHGVRGAFAEDQPFKERASKQGDWRRARRCRLLLRRRRGRGARFGRRGRCVCRP